MPIYDRSDSERHVQRGMNQAYRDTARHRADPLMNIGPTGKASPYIPQYELLLASSPPHALPWTTVKALPPTEGTFAPTACTTEQIKNALVRDQSRHVLPRPLTDIIIDVSRMRINRGDWYPSLVRMSWADETMQAAGRAMLDGHLNEAAELFAKVFGTMLPSVSTPLSPIAERELCNLAWKMLCQLVDPLVFSRMLVQAMRGVSPDDNSMSLLHLSRYTGGYRNIGPGELRAAEELLALEKALLDHDAATKAKLVTVSFNRWDVPTFSPSEAGTVIRFIGNEEIIQTTTKTGEGSKTPFRWVIDMVSGEVRAFIFDSDRGTLLETLQGKYREMGKDWGSLTNDICWYVRAPTRYHKYDPETKVAYTQMVTHCREGFCPGGDYPVSEEEYSNVQTHIETFITQIRGREADKAAAIRKVLMSKYESRARDYERTFRKKRKKKQDDQELDLVE